MTGDSIQCYNCGRQNPAWAQICRSCGVRLDPTLSASSAPRGAFPTDQRSLTSIGAALATILLGVLVAIFLSGIDPFDPTAARESPTPSIEPEPSGSLLPEPIPSASVPVAPTPTPVAGPPGTLSFGTGIDPNGAVTGATDAFGPQDTIAYTLSMPEPFGVPSVGLQVVQLQGDGSELEVISAATNPLDVDPAATSRAVICCQATLLLNELGPGQYVMRAYNGETVIAEGRFQLSEG